MFIIQPRSQFQPWERGWFIILYYIKTFCDF